MTKEQFSEDFYKFANELGEKWIDGAADLDKFDDMQIELLTYSMKYTEDLVYAALERYIKIDKVDS